MRFAYADPPYLGMGAKMYGCPEWDDPRAHWDLVERLRRDFPDGWAMSASAPSLSTILAGVLRVSEIRIGAWVKPWASYKVNVSPAFTWEPVLFMPGRKATREEPTGRDSLVCNAEIRRGFQGIKPDAFSFWLFEDIFNARPEDEFVDLFPGSGAVSRAWETWCGLRGRMTRPAGRADAHATRPLSPEVSPEGGETSNEVSR